MIKVSVLYPAGEGKTFNMDYYLNKHLPMVKSRLGAACKGAAVEQGVAGAAPGSSAPYVAMGHVYFESLADFQASFGAHVAEFVADVPNYTNIEPVIQISEVKM